MATDKPATLAAAKKQWFYFEANRLYLGKCECTLAEVKANFPWSEITGNLVNIYALCV